MEGHFVEEDVLYRRKFCMGGRFVEGRFVEGRYVDVSWKDVLWVQLVLIGVWLVSTLATTQ